MKPRRVVGINRTQDASICVLSSDGYAVAVQKERLTRAKHAWGNLDDISKVYIPNIPALVQPLDGIVECYSSDPELRHRDQYADELRRQLTLTNNSAITSVSHHLAHLYSCYFPSGFTDCAVMIIDCAGSKRYSIIESFPEPHHIDAEAVEVASYYSCCGNEIRCLYKSFWNFDWRHPEGIGAFYHLLTRAIFPGEGNEGKIMALASYGDHAAMGLPPLIVQDGAVFIPEEWRRVIVDSTEYRFDVADPAAFERAANLAASGQRCFETALLALTKWLKKITKNDNLCFAGGVALNCAANTLLQSESGFKNIYIPPAPHDGGTAIGCALFGMAELEGVTACKKFSWKTDYLGIPRNIDRLPAIINAYPDLELTKCADLAGHIAELLTAGEVIGLFQERSEFGPRALGNRSILADPRRAGIQRWVNENVKGRELFRPLAPTILAEWAGDFLGGNLNHARFMQYAVSVKQEKRQQIIGVIHHDASARVQILDPGDNREFYRIIDKFRQRTGIPLLLNTSFNGRNEPIVETIDDAIRCLQTTGLHAVAFPPFLLRKRQRLAVAQL